VRSFRELKLKKEAIKIQIKLLTALSHFLTDTDMAGDPCYPAALVFHFMSKMLEHDVEREDGIFAYEVLAHFHRAIACCEIALNKHTTPSLYFLFNYSLILRWGGFLHPHYLLDVMDPHAPSRSQGVSDTPLSDYAVKYTAFTLATPPKTRAYMCMTAAAQDTRTQPGFNKLLTYTKNMIIMTYLPHNDVILHDTRVSARAFFEHNTIGTWQSAPSSRALLKI
jgi:hypothetical protein